MRRILTSLRFRILLPVIVMVLFVVTLLTTLYSRAYINMILRQEQELNAVGFETVSHTVAPLIETNINEVRSIISDDRVEAYARLRYASVAELVHARIDCRDYLRSEIASRDKIFGLLFMRKDGSLFGALPEGNFFYDDPKDNPLSEAMQKQILDAPLGRTVWVGPVSGALLYGFENSATPKNIMIAAWKSVHVSYGECNAMMLMDESVFENLFASLRDGKSAWYLFTENQTEIYRTGGDASPDPDRLIRESNSGRIFRDENGIPVCTFSMTLDYPAWTLVRKVSMEGYERVVRGIARSIATFSVILLLITLAAYELWLKGFIRQFRSLLHGIVRMGQGDLESSTFARTSIEEFKQMQLEINRTRVALNQQMGTIRRLEREQMALENAKKEQERIEQELNMAREIQESALPHIFPSFPNRTEFSLHASMTPAKEVGGDFYDFFLVDSDHLAMVIADVSGKGIPAALFMMASKTLINNHLMTGCDPATALERVNLQLCENNTSKMFVTVWLAVLELSTGNGLACNAGHEHPALGRRGEGFELLVYKHNMFLGVSKKARYTNRPFHLNPGDSVFVYTDGVPEAHNRDGQMFGTERLERVLNQDGDAAPEKLIENVRIALDDFVQNAPQFDDVTMLAVKYYGTDDVRVGG